MASKNWNSMTTCPKDTIVEFLIENFNSYVGLEDPPGELLVIEGIYKIYGPFPFLGEPAKMKFFIFDDEPGLVRGPELICGLEDDEEACDYPALPVAWRHASWRDEA